MKTYAEEMPYWKTGKSDPQRWTDKAATEIERADGKILSEGFGAEGGKSAFILRFLIEEDSYRLVWPVLESCYVFNESISERRFLQAARRQAATMMYHDVKALCVKARVMGAKTAFFAHLEIQGGRVASDLLGDELIEFPKLLRGGVVDAEIVS